MQAKREWKCVTCGKTFLSPHWFGCMGDRTQKHAVEPKRYFSRYDAFTCFPVPERRGIDERGEKWTVPGITASFDPQGQYSTTDPQIQEWLDARMGSGPLISQEAYEDIKAPGLRQEREAAKLVETHEALAKAQAQLAALQSQIQQAAPTGGEDESAQSAKGKR